MLKEYNNRWFLFGFEHQYASLTNLGLDRIKMVKDSLQAFRSSDNFDPDAYLNDIVGVKLREDRKKETILLKAYGVQRHYIRTKKIHPSQQQIDLQADYGIFSLEVIPNYELTSRLLGYGNTLEVLSPDWYREEVKGVIEGMRAFYLSEDTIQ